MKDLVDGGNRKTRKDRLAKALAMVTTPPTQPVPPSLLIFASLLASGEDIMDTDNAKQFVKLLCDLRSTRTMDVRHVITSKVNPDNFFFKSGIKALETLVPTAVIQELADKGLLPTSGSFPSGENPFVPSYVGRVISVAYKCAMLGDQSGAKHGAVLFDKNDRVLSVGWNHRYDCGKKSKKKVIHAEVHAMLQVSDTSLFEDATIFILEAHARGSCFCNAHPCPSCNNVLTKFGVKQAIFTTDNGNLGVWSFKRKEIEIPTFDLAKSEGTYVQDNALTCKFIDELNIGCPT
jgi:deoxycytidylate deaminase